MRDHISVYKWAYLVVQEKSVSLCDGPDDDHLIRRNMLSIWHFYGIKEYCCADVLSFMYFVALRDASS